MQAAGCDQQQTWQTRGRWMDIVVLGFNDRRRRSRAYLEVIGVDLPPAIDCDCGRFFWYVCHQVRRRGDCDDDDVGIALDVYQP